MGSKSLAIEYRNLRDNIDPILEIFFLARFGLFMSVVASVLIAWPPQAIDAMRVLAEDVRIHWHQAICFWLAALGLCLFLWGSVQVMFRLRLPPSEERTSVLRFAMKHLPRVIAVLPLLAIVVASARANFALENHQTSRVLWIFAITSSVVALILYVVLSAWESLVQEHWESSLALEKPLLWPVHLAKIGLNLAVPLAIGAILVFTVDSQLARHLGPLTVLLLALIIWTTFGTALVRLGMVLRLPLLLGPLVLLIVWSSLDWNDNHAIHSLSTTSGDPVELPPLSCEFERWLAGRNDKDEYKVYPVFVVSTEGGGLYAAYFTAMVLSSLQDADSAFARHLFAISGVSGGSLGASVFAALASQTASNQTHAQDQTHAQNHTKVNLKNAADEILSRDFLSPLLATGLFPDAIQRFLPIPFPRVSRARALEKGFESAWADEAKKHRWDQKVFSRGFYELWDDFPANATPALLLNTTKVENGQRIVISNMHPDDPLYSEPKSRMRAERDASIKTLASISSSLRPPLSTAVSLSARFPLVTPAGSTIHKNKKYRFVDGGYFDNSGATTLTDVLISMHSVSGKHKGIGQDFRVMWIHIGSIDEKETEGKVAHLHTQHGLGELMSPLRALLNTRSGRTGTSVRQLNILSKQLVEHGSQVENVEFLLEVSAAGPPLGWLLSQDSREGIQAQLTAFKNQCSTTRVHQFLKDRRAATLGEAAMPNGASSARQ